MQKFFEKTDILLCYFVEVLEVRIEGKESRVEYQECNQSRFISIAFGILISNTFFVFLWSTLLLPLLGFHIHPYVGREK